MKNKITPSEETQKEAMKIAKATQKPGQTKEQTRLVAQGIEKGIAIYKKQQKERNRKADKAKKKVQREKEAGIKETPVESINTDANQAPTQSSTILPWVLLVLSWGLFIGYFIINK